MEKNLFVRICETDVTDIQEQLQKLKTEQLERYGVFDKRIVTKLYQVKSLALAIVMYEEFPTVQDLKQDVYDKYWATMNGLWLMGIEV